MLFLSIEDPLHFLRSTPQFETMRRLVQSNPGLLSNFLQEIRQANPRLFQVHSEWPSPNVL